MDRHDEITRLLADAGRDFRRAQRAAKFALAFALVAVACQAVSFALVVLR